METAKLKMLPVTLAVLLLVAVAEGDPADCTGDDFVDARDLLILCDNWLTEGLPTAADINGDGAVDLGDYCLLAAKWLQGLVAHWKLDETDGDIAYDSAGHNDAIVHNGAWTEGRIGGALDLNGLTTYLDCGDSEVLGPEKMTLTMWLKPEHMGGMRYVLARANESTDVMDYMLMRQREGELELAVGQLGSDPVSVLSTGQTPLNEWSQVAVRLDGSEASIYINGQPDAAFNYGERIACEGHRLVVSSYQGDTRFYNGQMDDIRIYNAALSAEDIEALYNEASE